jgi:uncharacterized membrane protein
MTNFINTALAHTAESGEVDTFAAHHGFGMMGGFGWTGMFFGWTMMILFWVIVILAVVALVKYISRGGYNNSGENDKTIRSKASNSLGKTYICAECGYEYEEKEWALKCQKWCAQHKSCNMDIIKHGVPPRI